MIVSPGESSFYDVVPYLVVLLMFNTDGHAIRVVAVGIRSLVKLP